MGRITSLDTRSTPQRSGLELGRAVALAAPEPVSAPEEEEATAAAEVEAAADATQELEAQEVGQAETEATVAS